MISALKKAFGRGLVFAVPLGIVVYIGYKAVKAVEKIVEPLAKKLGIEKLLGEITLFVLALLAVVILILLLGWLMKISFISKLAQGIEGFILHLFPSLNHLKLMATEKLDLQTASLNWKPVLMKRDDQYLPAYIIEENGEWVILGLVKGYNTDPVEMLIARKSSLSLKEITLSQMHKCNKQYGKGYLALIEQS